MSTKLNAFRAFRVGVWSILGFLYLPGLHPPDRALRSGNSQTLRGRNPSGSGLDARTAIIYCTEHDYSHSRILIMLQYSKVCMEHDYTVY